METLRDEGRSGIEDLNIRKREQDGQSEGERYTKKVKERTVKETEA